MTRFFNCVIAILTICLSQATNADQRPLVSLGSIDELSHRMRATVVYQRDDGVYKTNIGESDAQLLVKNGSYPRWSPDGQYIAFISKKNVSQVNANGERIEVLARTDSPRAIAYHPNGEEVLFIDGKAIYSVAIKTREVRLLIKGHRFQELDITKDGSQLAVTIKNPLRSFQVYGFDLRSGTNRRLGKGCSAGMPPSGKLVSNLQDGHKKLMLIDWAVGETRFSIDAPPGEKFDNHAWSNLEDWLVSESEINGHNIYVHEVSKNRATRVTDGGNDQRPDLYIYELF